MTRALIIEPSDSHVETIVQALRGDGLDVDCVREPAAARDYLALHSVDLVLCALGLPGEQYLEFCRWFRRFPATSQRVLIVHSHKVEPAHILGSLEAGADAFLSLMRPAEELSLTVRRTLARGPRSVTPDDGRTLVSFRGRPYALGMDRDHLLDVLVSAFEDLDHLNEQLRRETGERGRAEADIFRMQERFDLAVQGTGDGIWDWDVEHSRVYFSPRWKSMLGYEDHELENTFDAWVGLLHPDDRDRAMATIQSYFEGRTATYELEHRLRHKDGSYRWILARGRALRDASGRAYRMAGSHADITERKQIEDELRARESQLRRFNRVLMDLAVDDAVLDDDLTTVMRHFTERISGTLGISRCSIWLLSPDHAELRCHDLFEAAQGRHSEGTILRADQFPNYFKALESERIIAAHDARTDPRTAEFRDKYLAPLNITSMLDAPLRLRGEVVGVLCSEQIGSPRYWSTEQQNFAVSVASLVSLALEGAERRRAEREARAAKEAAEAASRAKSDFMANMSHEIRTPMNAIIGMTELTLETTLTGEQREYLELVRKSAENLLGVINEVLDFSKIEAGRIELERGPFNLYELVSEVLGSLAPRAFQKGLELTGHIAPDLPENLIGDASRLRQVLLNLVGNAVKFTESGEVVLTVAPAMITNGSALRTVRLIFAVRDTGIGIPDEKRRAIFEPFTQADNSTTRRYGGTGLGLTISSRLVALMGGVIEVESEVGRGSTFRFTVGFDLPTQTGLSRPVRPEEFIGLPVLIVDDNAANRYFLEETLKHWGMNPTCAAGAREALDALELAGREGRPFALVLLDGQMPGTDGFALAEQIQRRPDLVCATIMMLSSGGRPGDVGRCEQLGIAAHLIKPIRQRDLRRAVEQVLGAAGQHAVRTAAPETVAGRRLRILLAEDNPVNQKLAVRMLEKRGHQVFLAVTGREAVRRWQAEQFDIILMDVQMPEMDGLEAAYTIRERESGTGKHIPILAMTAYAMKGDRERCLDAGMDDYVSKPIRSEELFAAIDRLTGNTSATPANGGAVSSNEPDLKTLVDWQEALAHVGGDEPLLRDLIATFLGELDNWQRQLHDAIARRDATALEKVAHPIKNSLNLLGATEAGRLMYELECMGRRRDLAGCDDVMNSLQRMLERLIPALRRFAGAIVS